MGYQAPTWVNNGAPSLSAENMQQISNWLEYCSNNMVNPNLLDNWYFGNPVDQRDGKIIQQGVNIYQDSTLETLIGPAAYAYPVVDLTSTYAKVQDAKVTGTYYAAPGDVVRGYPGSGYGIDRWQLSTPPINLTLSDGCITISNTEQGTGGTISEKTEVKNTGSPVVISVLLKNGTLFVNSGAPTADAKLEILKDGLYAGFRVAKNNCLEALFYFTGTTVAQENIVAVKLELGTQQTLAHQENGVWVLNEIPDYAEQLLKCQRYLRPAPLNFIVSNSSGNYYASGIMQSPYPMRTVPAIVNGNYTAQPIREVTGGQTATVSQVFTPSVYGSLTMQLTPGGSTIPDWVYIDATGFKPLLSAEL